MKKNSNKKLLPLAFGGITVLLVIVLLIMHIDVRRFTSRIESLNGRVGVHGGTILGPNEIDFHLEGCPSLLKDKDVDYFVGNHVFISMVDHLSLEKTTISEQSIRRFIDAWGSGIKSINICKTNSNPETVIYIARNCPLEDISLSCEAIDTNSLRELSNLPQSITVYVDEACFSKLLLDDVSKKHPGISVMKK